MNVINNGTPITSYVEGWTGQNVSVKTDVISQIKYYDIASNGFITQSNTIQKTLTKLDLSCMYKGTGKIVCTIISDDTFDVVCTCSGANEWTKAELTVPLGVFIRSVRIKAEGIKSFKVTHIYGVAEQSIEAGIQTAENFMQKAILYGRDADKPNLREVSL